MTADDKELIKNRNKAIKAAYAKGDQSAREIGEKYGVSVTRVLQIVGKRPDQGPARSNKPKKRETENAQEKEIDHHFEQQLAYFFGRIEAQCEVFANQLGYPVSDVTRRLSELLSRKNVGKMVRSRH